MNPAGEMILKVFGILFAVVVVVLAVPYLTPYAGSASSGLVSTSNEYVQILPFVGLIIVGGAALMAMEGRRRS